MLNWIAIFAATLIADYFWAKWTAACTANLALDAAIYSALIVGCGGFTIVEYTSDHWLLIPAAAGAAVGTYYAVVKP